MTATSSNSTAVPRTQEPRRTSLLRQWPAFVKFSHTVFALPFALASMWLAAGGWPSLKTVLLVLLAMAACRNAAMAFNRLVDARFDAKNPRTAGRHLPAGLLSTGQGWAFFAVNALLFLGASVWLNPLAGWLSPLALSAVCGYSLTKRFTSLSHFFLGMAIGISPMGAWIAVRGSFGWEALYLVAALWLWIAGFDVIYATQDEAFDRRQGLHSLAVRLGKDGALRASAVCHALCWGILAAFGWSRGFGPVYYGAVGIVGLALLYLHAFRRGASLDSLNQDFFQANAAISVLVMAGVAWEVFVRR